MVLDVNGNRLDAKFLRETGAVEDYFTIIKGPGSANTPPSVSLTNPADGQSFTAPAQIAIAATASDPDPGGSITKVEFFQGVTKLGEDTTEPYELAWNNVPAGSYSLSAKATDDLGATSTSATVTVNVTEPGAVPAAPTNLQATAGKRKVTLRWSQSTSPDIAQNRIYRSTDGSSYALLSTISATTLVLGPRRHFRNDLLLCRHGRQRQRVGRPVLECRVGRAAVNRWSVKIRCGRPAAPGGRR